MKEPHTALFIALTGVGKTHLALSLLETEYRNHFDFIVIICPTLRYNSTYKSRGWVWNDPDVIPIEPGNQLYYLIEKISNLLTGDKTLFLIDDIIADETLDKHHQPLLELVILGRHRAHSLWLLTQSYTAIPNNIRRQAKMKYLGFSTSTIDWFNSYLTNRSFIVNVGKEYSSPGKLSCGVPQGSILGPLLFLLYVNDMPQAVNSELLLYADDTCLIYTAKDTKTIKEQLNSDFNSLCEWFIDNKLSIHFGEDKTKSILFGTKRHLKNQTDLDIKYGDIKIKQHNKVTYLGCILDSNLSGESMATKVLGLVNGRLKFLYRKQRFLTFSLRRLLCNALIQPHYDYSCSAWYPSLSKRLLKKIQISQNKCIRYCLKLDNRSHVGFDEFKELNWLPTKERVFQCICVNIFKFFNDMSPEYTSEIFHPSHHRHNTCTSMLMLDLPFRKSCFGQKTLSYLGPKTWNTLPAEIKLRKNVNTFKHDIKKLFFEKLQKDTDDIFIY